MLPTFLIGLREGLEAALVVGILLAYLKRIGRPDVRGRLWIGVSLAIALSVGIGAILTFGAYALTFEAMEIIGGGMSILAVGLVTWMIFWMQKAARDLRKTLEGDVDRALAAGGMWGIVVIGFVSVAREGIETTLFLWSAVQGLGRDPNTLLGALLGIIVAVVLGTALAKGMVRLNLRAFFSWTGGLLIIVAAGVLAYGIHDLQEAGVLPGPYTAAAPLAADGVTVLTGWAGFPFGFAFDVSGSIDPTGAFAALAQATVGFMPAMTWLQVLAWGLYILIVGTIFVRRLRAAPAPNTSRQAQPGVVATATAPGRVETGTSSGTPAS